MARASTYRLLVVVVAICAPVIGCGRKPEGAPKAEAPAKVAQTPKETRLNTIELTEEAEKRLGLQTAPVVERAFSRQRSYAGEVTLPASALLTISAPVSGTLKISKGQDLPQVGSPVRKGDTLFTLVPHVLTQGETVSLYVAQLQLKKTQVDAESQVSQAKVQLEAARIEFERNHRLVSQGANPKKDEDDAQAKLELAQKVYDASLDLKKLVDGMKLDKSDGLIKPLPMPSPRDGLLRATFA